jgi:dihydrodipicolinate synthase/N-acetylneuraminate lyase
MVFALPEGVLPVVQTPFTDDGRIDDATMRREVDWMFDCGVDGVTVAMVSEVLRLEHGERRHLAELVCDATAGRGPVVVSVGAESTGVAVAFTEHAQSAGAAAVMAIPPLSVAPSDRELQRYFDAIVTATDLPLIVQDASAYVGDPLSLDLQAGLMARHGRRVGFKPEAQPLGLKLSALLGATNGEALVYDGSGGIALIDTFRRGLVGTMPSADLAWAIVRLWRQLRAGDLAAAYRLSLPLVALVAMQTSLDAYISVEKYLLLQQKVFVNTVVRGPVAYHLDALTIEQIDSYFGLLKQFYEEAGA